ncbi:MAG TPA: sorbitol dehydrogenase, partial [Firmicutes bacterium]|nr:sorbitol dehydrogenase [Bacillota bacterium]
MKALMKVSKGKGNIEIRDVEMPKMKNDEVLIEVKYVGICGSDLHIEADEHPNHPPVILGHEYSGVIKEVGSAVEGWKVGDRVVSELHAGACHQCVLCKTGNAFACPSKHPIGWWTNGTYVKYIAISSWLLHQIPDKLSLFNATLTEPLAVCMNILQRAPVAPQSFVAVIGPGPIGILSALAAKAAGAGKVAIVGRNSSLERLKLASELGIDYIINNSVQDVESEIRSLTNGMGADLVIETGGTENSVLDAIKAVRKLGTIAALGVGKGTYNFPWNDVIFKAINIVFSFSANYL